MIQQHFAGFLEWNAKNEKFIFWNWDYLLQYFPMFLTKKIDLYLVKRARYDPEHHFPLSLD